MPQQRMLRRPLRRDPTNSRLLRAKLIGEIRRRVARVKFRVRQLVEKEDAFGVQNAGRFAFAEDSAKLEAFQRWLRLNLDAELNDKQLWEQYARMSFQKGGGRAFDDVRAKYGLSADRETALREAFGSPVSVDRIKVLAQRSFTDMEGVTASMGTRMSRALADGLTQGESAKQIADRLSEAVDFDADRAMLTARTEITRAHAEGQLDMFEKLGIESVGAEVELATSGLPNVCPECADLDGKTYSLDEAAGVIPVHPDCACAWLPSVGANNSSYFAECERDDKGRCLPGADQRSQSLKSLPVAKTEKLGGGINETQKVTLQDGTVGCWKPSTGETSDVPRNVKAGTYYRREGATSDIAEYVGMHDMVPKTVIRDIGGKTGSFQEFVKGGKVARAIDDKTKRFGDGSDLARAVAFDTLIGNIDRHAGNWIVKGSNIKLIDNGGSLPVRDDKDFRSRLVQEASERKLPVPKEVMQWDAKGIDRILANHGIEQGARKLVQKRLLLLKRHAGRPFSSKPE